MTTPRPLPGGRHGGVLLGVLLLLGLPACSLRAPLPDDGLDWNARNARVQALERWELRGRIAVKSAAGGGQGDLAWQQQDGASDIRVSGPFGAGAYEIHWDADAVSVRSRNGELTRTWSGQGAAEQFLAEQLGWSFPAVSARYWLLGLPDPGFPASATYAAGSELAMLEQNGWTVTYERYVAVAQTPMPAKIVLENPRVRLRLVVDRWNF